MLELINVFAGYAGQNIIRDISLCFEAGRIHIIVGRNGCGKTTLLKACAGLLSAGSGDILLQGKPLQQYPPIERAKLVSYLSQSRNTPAISAERLVEHGRYPRLASPRRLNEDDRRIIEASMERMQIAHLRKKSLNELSGGEQQRVYIAMLLAQDTPVLLLDEPTTYMDIEHQLALLELLTELKHEGKCVVMVLHDLTLALKYSDTIIAMENGTIAQAASPETMLSDSTLNRIFHVEIQAVGDPAEGYVLRKLKPRRC